MKRQAVYKSLIFMPMAIETVAAVMAEQAHLGLAELLRQLRADARTKLLPVVVLEYCGYIGSRIVPVTTGW